jgi:hypothetical protein
MADACPELTLSDPARDVLWRFRGELEPRLDPHDGDLHGASDWAGKLAGSCVRISALLHLYDHGWAGGIATPIEATAMKSAVTIADYLVPHALIALGLTGPLGTAVAPARAILRWISREQVIEFKASDVLDALTRSVMPDMTTVESALTFLQEMRYVRQRGFVKTGRPGRPPSPTYDVNPLLTTSPN